MQDRKKGFLGTPAMQVKHFRLRPIKPLLLTVGSLAMLIFLSGCVGTGNWGKVKWPAAEDLGRAAQKAASQPQTWVPLLLAGALQIDDKDEDWSEDLRQRQDLFGEDAEDRSSDFRDVATAAYLLTAVFAPSETVADKGRGLTLGAATMLADGVINQGLKNLSGRERPESSNDESMPSGHASKASSRTNMAIHNIRLMDIAPWQKRVATWGLHGVSAATGLSRVEAGKHYLGDVLVGYAMGHFVSEFMYEAFMPERTDGSRISLLPLRDGAALTLHIPLK